MSKPQLSILVPAIPTRFDRAKALVGRLQEMIGDRNVEVLLLMDNKIRTIGEKRDELKNLCRGKYFMFVDDDDDLLRIEHLYEATFSDVDVITFKQRCLNSDKSTFIVTFGLGNPVEHNQVNGIYTDIRRPPWHVCAWNERFRDFHYPPINYSEDWEWLKQVLPLAKTEIHLDEVVHGYNYDPKVTEASTASNECWTNPNDKPKAKQCIVTLATLSEKYVNGVKRQTKSLQDVGWINGEGAALQFFGENIVGAPRHEDNPYAFKLYAIDHARNLGYEQVLWLDASVIAVKSPAPVFKWLDNNEVFFEEAGHYVGTWCNGGTLAYFGLPRMDAMKMPMFAAGYCGFDFRTKTAQDFFDRWWKSMEAGAFRGSWADHRHDMTCASIIANQMGLLERYSPGGQFFAYIGPAYSAPKETVCFHLIGL